MKSEITYVNPVPRNLAIPEVAYKFREINELTLKSLLLNQVWFSRPASFNDPYELFREFESTGFGEALKWDIQEAGVFCLCKSPMNLPMWSYYGDGLKGVAIGYKLREFLTTVEPISPAESEHSRRWKYLYDVEYTNRALAPINGVAMTGEKIRSRDQERRRAKERRRIFATKPKAFEHENEFRIVIEPSVKNRLSAAWVGHGLYLHSPTAICELIFGELMPEQDQLALLKAVEGRNIKINRAIRRKDSFGIHLIPFGQ